jgi:hypothetical protein
MTQDPTQLNTIAFIDDDLVEIRFSKPITRRQEILELCKILPQTEVLIYNRENLSILGIRCNPKVWLNYLQQTENEEAKESFKQAMETAKVLYTTEMTT